MLMNVKLISYTLNPVKHCTKIAGITTDKEERTDCDEFIRKIVKIGHLGVLEHAVFCFKVEGISRACSHQWVRHRIGSFLQRSQRRVDESKANFITPLFDYLTEENKRQALLWFDNAMLECKNNYDLLISIGVRPEDARFVLPNATETQLYWTVDGRALRHFFKLRLHKSSQWEIREMAKKMFELLTYACPIHFTSLVYRDGEPPFYEDPPFYCSECKAEVEPVALPFFKDLTSLYLTGEYSGEEGGLE